MAAALSTLAIVLALAVTSAPAVVTAAQDAGDEVVTVISLTDAGGDRTPVATAGIEELTSSTPGQPGTAEVSWTDRTVASLIAAAPAVVEPDAAEPTAIEDVAVLTPAMATPEFFVAGLTWSGPAELGEDVHAFVRMHEPMGWSEWMELGPDGAGPDDLPEGAVSGSDPLISAGGRGIQVQLSGDPAALPADLQLSLVPADPGRERDVVSEPLPRPADQPTEAPVAPPHADEEAPVSGADAADAALVEQAATSASRAAPLATAAATASAAGDRAARFALGSATPSGAAARDAALALPTVPTAVIPPEPTVITRAGWGVDEQIPIDAEVGPWTVRYADLRAGVVHHTAGSNSYRPEDSAAIVRGIYYFHAVTREWADIGYNFLVDRFGRVFEGRKGTLQSDPGEMVTAGHARGYNAGTVGISVMGNFESVSAPQVSLDRIADVFAWQFARSDLDLAKTSGMLSPGTPTRPAGQLLPRVFGHKDVASTSCPGTIYERIPAIVRATRARMPQLHYLNNAFSPIADVSFYYGDLDGQVLTGDWDGDGTDTIAVRIGRVYFIRNSNSHGPADRVVAYGRPEDEVLVGDWNGDGVDTLAVRRGAIYYIKNSLTSGAADRVVAYGRPEDEVLVGDWNGNTVDTLAVRRGFVYHIRNSLSSGPAQRVIAYGRAQDDVLVGDWDGNTVDTLAVRRGAQYYIKNSLTTGVADLSVIYGSPSDLVIVGDWDGDTADTLGVRRLS